MSTSMSLWRSAAVQLREDEASAAWQPVPGKRTLTQQLPVQRKAEAEAGASEQQASQAPSASASSASASPASPAGEHVSRVGHGGFGGAASGQLADPFAVHLLGGPQTGQANRPQTGLIQRKAIGEALRGGGELDGGEAVATSASAEAGQALPDDVRAKMEQAFGADFSAVRVHEGAQAAQLGALAYAQGHELHFAPGQYQPHSQAGQELIGHELAHVVQQAQGRVQATAQGKGAAIHDDTGLEREADELGARAARGEAVHGGGATALAPTSAAMALEAVQCRKVNTAVPPEAKLRAGSKGEWMIVQGLASLGYPQWHLTIFPTGQDGWRGAYAKGGEGSRDLKVWMEYDEFHLTSPEGEHFYYTDGCVPLPGSQSTSGKSPAWASDHWQWANYLCAAWFSVDLQALNDYVAQRPQQEQAERNDLHAEEQHQERMWRRYLHWVKQCPEMYEKTKMEPGAWYQQLRDGFRGTDEEFREQLREEDRENGGKLPDYPKRQWRDDDEGFGYV